MDKYVKIKKIGEGSFGKAILVKSKDSEEQFVVKEIGISRMKPKEKSEARKEVTVLSKMRHPNIVQYTESFEENGHLYIVMEYCEGGDLYALINKQKGTPFSEQQVLNWFVQLCLALKHVHDRKILHRDIKTSNIFLTKSGTIKLGDFGIARVLNNTMELARTCIGTPYYLSPEICENKPYNNKSDVWALGCVVYETLTLKHAFEAGNMKNLVLKIIRGSYPPVPSRYSYDLRTLVSHLFRRNPRERPSINSILRKPFLSNLSEQFLSPEQHEDEFSHTVLHKGRPPRPSSAKPPSYAGRYQPVAGKRAENLEVRGGAIGARNRREHQIASVYGPSVAAKKPKSAVSRPPKGANEVYLEKRRQQLMEQEKRRKEALAEEKKKRLENLQNRQRERALRLKDDQLRRARDEARDMNLKRSAELMEPRNNEAAGNKYPTPFANAPRDRPVSAPKERGDYDKYHQYLSKMENGDRYGAEELAAPGLDRVKKAWEERQRGQEAVLAAQINNLRNNKCHYTPHSKDSMRQMDADGFSRASAVQAADRAEVVREFLQRKNEARFNKNKDMRAKENKVGVSAALRPYSGSPARDVEEQNYLSKLQQIREQNYNERKLLNKKHENKKKAYKVEVPASSDVHEDEEQRKRKVQALQQQAAERAKVLQENLERRRGVLDAQQGMKHHEAKARARGIVPPDERPVKYTPAPISVTQALHAVGAPVLPKQEEKTVDEMLSPSRANPHLRKKILRRVNERFSVDYEEDQKKADEVEKNETETSERKENIPRPLPECPEKPKEEPRKESAWQARKNEDIVNQISGLPLQETTTLLEGTNAPVSVHPPVAKRQWQAPGGTFVRKLNQMTLQDPTMTLPVDTDKEPHEKSSTKKAESPEKPYSPAERTKISPTSQQPSEKSSIDRIAPSVDNRTIVLKKGSIVDSTAAPSGSQTPEKKLAANFRPVKPLGTYVIKSLDGDTPISDNKETSPSKEKDTRKDSGLSSKPKDDVKTNLAKEKDDKVEIKPGSPAKPSDISDDIEEVELKNESKSRVKTTEAHSAWSEESETKSQALTSKPPLIPKPMIPKRSLSPKSPPKSTRSSLNKDRNKSSIESNTPEKETAESSTPPSATSQPPVCESPLFSRVNKTKSEGISTTPNPKIDRLERSDTPSSLSKTLYCTASDQMLMKITLGHFDSPNPKLLRTCSLPDLNLASDDPGGNEDAVEDHGGEAIKEVSVMSSMNDTNFDDDENVTLRSLSDPEPGSDEDEMNDLRANLQSVLLNSSKPDSTTPFSSKLSTSVVIHGENDGSGSSSEGEEHDRLYEDWQSDSGTSEDEDLSDAESIFSRLEDIREELEKELSLEKFKKAYRYVQASHEDEDEEVMQCQSHVRAVLGEKHDELYPKILQLVMADGAYCEDNA